MNRALTNRRGSATKNRDYTLFNNDTSSHSHQDLVSSSHNRKVQPSSKHRRRHIQGHQHNHANLCISIVFGVVIFVSFFELLFLCGTYSEVPRYVHTAATAGNLQSKKMEKKHLRVPRIQPKQTVYGEGFGTITVDYICNDGTRLTYNGVSHDMKSIINDGYCDCSDGSDELSTDACSHILVQQPLFLCDHNMKAIYPSRVGDGIPDCVDRTDEEE